MILELLSVGLVISACLAIFLDEAVYSVAALAGTFFLTSMLYALSGAVFVAVFQFAVGAGTLAILFLAGEMLSEKPAKVPQKNLLSLVAVGVLLSLPAIFLSVSGQTGVFSAISFEEALWDLRAMDVVLQGFVIMTVALGIVIILHEKRKGGK
ncbi:NADH-quinone oxidoreductase subunit J [Candidatus Bathyarchaeota archaeon]|nr:NADH-quinone oxidoreductase subunit J [Candidatus Bathyarchaeota archaeon]